MCELINGELISNFNNINLFLKCFTLYNFEVSYINKI